MRSLKVSGKFRSCLLLLKPHLSTLIQIHYNSKMRMSVVLLLRNCVTNYTLVLLKWQNFNEHIKLFAINIYSSIVKMRHICYILGRELFLAQRKKTTQKYHTCSVQVALISCLQRKYTGNNQE